MKNDASKIIDSLGGTVAVAKACGLRPQAISRWRNKGIPRPWLILLQSRVIQPINREKKLNETPRKADR